MVAMIATLIDRGHAYAAEGHVLFSVSSYPEYGKLARRSLDEMRAGARVEVAPYKRDPMDFVLWKPSDADTPGWDSPWGRGGRAGTSNARPWRTNCWGQLRHPRRRHRPRLSAPRERVAQSRCAHPEGRFARIWMHNGFLNVEGEKMSKSLGNFFTVRDLLTEYKRDFGIPNFGPAIRLRLIAGHYRSPIDASRSFLEEAATKLDTYRHFLRGWTKPVDLKDFRIAASASGVIEALMTTNTPRIRLYLYDTTLRDGQQTQGVRLLGGRSRTSVARIATALDALGIDYVEGGWPGRRNFSVEDKPDPTDGLLRGRLAGGAGLLEAAPALAHARMAAFGMTKRAGRSAANDEVLAGVLNARTPVVCLVGKTHDFHVTTALEITLEENLANIRDSVAHLVAQGREAIFDAEHFFDGWKANPAMRSTA
jgi:hypothetical protein